MTDNNYKFIRGKYVLTMNQSDDFIKDGLVVIKDNLVVDIGSYEDLCDKYRGVNGEWLEYQEGLIMPGLVCNHTHLYQAMMKGVGSTLCLDEWVVKVIYPMALAMGRQEFYDACRLNILEMISTGTTCFVDSQYHNHNLDNIDGVADAVKDMGMRGMLVRGVQTLNFDERIPDVMAESDIEITKRESIRCLETYHNTDNGRIRVGLEALTEFDCNEETIKLLHQLAEEYDTRFQMHVAETIVEQCKIRGDHNSGIIEYIDSLGVLSERTLLIHNIYVTPNEINLIAEREANVSHNPVSNMILADGIAPVPEFLAADIPVGIGVDGAASNNNQDMFEALKTCALLHRVNKLDASVLTAYDVLKMGTISSAKTIGWDDEIGSLEIGKKADLIVVKTNSCHMSPDLDAVTNLVFSGNGRDVDTVMIDGNIIMKDRKFSNIDADKIVAKGSETAMRVAKEADIFNII